MPLDKIVLFTIVTRLTGSSPGDGDPEVAATPPGTVSGLIFSTSSMVASWLEAGKFPPDISVTSVHLSRTDSMDNPAAADRVRTLPGDRCQRSASRESRWKC